MSNHPQVGCCGQPGGNPDTDISCPHARPVPPKVLIMLWNRNGSRPRIDLFRGALFAVLGAIFMIVGVHEELNWWNLGFGFLLFLGGAYTAVSAYRELQQR